MRYDPHKHHRRSIRLRGYDYAASGRYFVTICVQGRRCLFGTIVEGELALNDAGRIVGAVWEALPERFPTIAPDVYVVMPNHFHAVVSITEALATPEPSEGSLRLLQTLGDIVGVFKSLTTYAYIRGVHEQGWPPFDRRLWQRNYYEHIIRDEAALARIRAYIENNPACWAADQLHPAAPL
jgi:REP-associated tyrosine transposase